MRCALVAEVVVVLQREQVAVVVQVVILQVGLM
jgi:hypothetical protein